MLYSARNLQKSSYHDPTTPGNYVNNKMSVSEERELEEMGLQCMFERMKISKVVDIRMKAVPWARSGEACSPKVECVCRGSGMQSATSCGFSSCY